MNAMLRRLRQLQIAMLSSIVLCAIVAEWLSRRSAHSPANTLFHAFSVISVALVGATFVVRQTLVVPAEANLIRRPDDAQAAARSTACWIFLYCMCESLGLFGVVLRLGGFPLANVWGFYLGSFLLLLLYFPGRHNSISRHY